MKYLQNLNMCYNNRKNTKYKQNTYRKKRKKSILVSNLTYVIYYPYVNVKKKKKTITKT